VKDFQNDKTTIFDSVSYSYIACLSKLVKKEENKRNIKYKRKTLPDFK